MTKFSSPLEASIIGRKAWRFTPNDLPNNIPQIINVVSGGIDVPDGSIVNEFDYTPVEGIGGNFVYPPNADETTEGLVALATEIEAKEGTNSSKVITPATLKQVLDTKQFDYVQTSPSATWIVAHNLNKIPNVDVYLSNGEQILADITATDTTITVVFAEAQTGYIVAI